MRKVVKITAELCGLEATSTQVSRAAALLDVELYKDTAPKLATWAENNFPEGLSVFQLPKNIARESAPPTCSKDKTRRTRVATLFPNEASLLRLVTAVLVELSDDWETGMKYLIFQK